MQGRNQTAVRRLRAANASAMTHTGTNSYVLGRGRVVVVDPGPDDPAHLAAILGALDPFETVEAIVVTHPHLDHSALAPALARAVSAPVLGFGPAGSGIDPAMQALAAAGLTGGGEGVDHGFAPDRRLTDGEELAFGALTLRVLHSPGHMGSHICLAAGDMLVSGDHVMGWASSLVSPPEGDMGAYIAGLEGLARGSWTRFLPGHGEAIEDPAGRLAELIAHRRQREAQVLAALEHGPDTARGLAGRIYADTPAALLPAATRNVLAHLIDLAARNLVRHSPPLTAETRFARK